MGLGPLFFATLPALDVSVSPPAHGSPGDNAAWWGSLSPSQQQLVIQQHPGWIGNRDGVSFAARDQANRSLLPLDRIRLEAERMRLETALAENWLGGAFTNDDAALAQVTDKLAAPPPTTSPPPRVGARGGPCPPLPLNFWSGLAGRCCG